MFRRGTTINLGDFQSERIDIEFPFDTLRPGQAFEDAVQWINTRLQQEIDKITEREAAQGNYVDPRRVDDSDTTCARQSDTIAGQNSLAPAVPRP